MIFFRLPKGTEQNLSSDFDTRQKSIRDADGLFENSSNTDDKLQKKPENQIKDRAELIIRNQDTKGVKLEGIKLKKMGERNIRKNIRNYKITKEIVEESLSTRKVKRTLRKGKNTTVNIHAK